MTLIVIQVLYCYVFQQRCTCNHKRIVLLTDMQNASLCNDEIWACWTAGWPAWLKKNKSLMLLFSLNMRLRTSFHAFGVLLREIIR